MSHRAGEFNRFPHLRKAKFPSLLSGMQGASSKSRARWPVGTTRRLGAFDFGCLPRRVSQGAVCWGQKGQKETTITKKIYIKINQRTTPKPSLSLAAAGKGLAGGRSPHSPPPRWDAGVETQHRRPTGSSTGAREGAGERGRAPARPQEAGRRGAGAGSREGWQAAGLAHREPLDCLPASLCSSTGRGNGAAGRGGGRERPSRFLSSRPGN